MKKIVHSATDGLNLTVFQKTFGAIPALGDLSESVTGVFVGSAILIKNGFRVEFLQGVDLFPYTYHIESVALFKK